MKEKREGFKQDLKYEGKDEIYLDEDRIVNEGLSGGSVHRKGSTTNIEEARELMKEEPPHHIED
jgi:hypothetical protein